MLESILNADRALFIWLNGFHANFLDGFMIAVSGKFTFLPLYVIAFWAIIKANPKFWWLTIFAVVLTISLSDRITSGILKPTTERLRPCWEPELQKIIHMPEGCSGKYGFASSHSANAFAAAFLVLGLLGNTSSKPRWIIYTAYGWATLVAYSRLYLGKHYPLDLLVGAFVGLLSAFMVLKIYHWATLYLKAKN